MGGIIIFENGDTVPFGQITRLDLMLSAINRLKEELQKQEIERLKQLLEVYNAGTGQTDSENHG